MDDAERAEFIGAIVQLTRAIQQILGLTERRLGMSEDTRGFSAQELVDARAQATLWRQQVDALTIHVATLTVPPRSRPPRRASYCLPVCAFALSALSRNVNALPPPTRSSPRKRCPSAVTAY